MKTRDMQSSGLLRTLGLFGCMLLASMAVQGQTYKVKKESKVSVEGTSTLHGWTTVVNEFEGTIGFIPAFVKKPKVGAAVQTVDLKFKVASMDGGRGEAMNEKIFAALQSDKHPYVQFKSSEAPAVTSIKDAKQGIFILKAKGSLSMAGVEKPVEMELEGQKMTNGTFHFTGKKTMNLKDFSIEPPTAMFGQIVTGEEITIVFDLIVAP